METIISMDARGRMSLPANIRKIMNMDRGGDWVARCEEGKIILSTKEQQVQEHIQKLQAMVREKLPESISLADVLIAERQAEASQDSEGDS